MLAQSTGNPFGPQIVGLPEPPPSGAPSEGGWPPPRPPKGRKQASGPGRHRGRLPDPVLPGGAHRGARPGLPPRRRPAADPAHSAERPPVAGRDAGRPAVRPLRQPGGGAVRGAQSVARPRGGGGPAPHFLSWMALNPVLSEVSRTASLDESRKNSHTRSGFKRNSAHASLKVGVSVA